MEHKCYVEQRSINTAIFRALVKTHCSWGKGLTTTKSPTTEERAGVPAGPTATAGGGTRELRRTHPWDQGTLWRPKTLMGRDMKPQEQAGRYTEVWHRPTALATNSQPKHWVSLQESWCLWWPAGNHSNNKRQPGQPPNWINSFSCIKNLAEGKACFRHKIFLLYYLWSSTRCPALNKNDEAYEWQEKHTKRQSNNQSKTQTWHICWNYGKGANGKGNDTGD